MKEFSLDTPEPKKKGIDILGLFDNLVAKIMLSIILFVICIILVLLAAICEDKEISNIMYIIVIVLIIFIVIALAFLFVPRSSSNNFTRKKGEDGDSYDSANEQKYSSIKTDDIGVSGLNDSNVEGVSIENQENKVKDNDKVYVAKTSIKDKKGGEKEMKIGKVLMLLTILFFIGYYISKGGKLYLEQYLSWFNIFSIGLVLYVMGLFRAGLKDKIINFGFDKLLILTIVFITGICFLVLFVHLFVTYVFN